MNVLVSACLLGMNCRYDGDNNWEPALASLTGKIGEHLARFGGESLETGTIVYSKEYGILGMSENARELLEKCKEGASWCIL